MTKNINISTIIATISTTAFFTQNLMHLTQSPHRGVPSSPSTAGISREEIPAFLSQIEAGGSEDLPESNTLNPDDKMFRALTQMSYGGSNNFRNGKSFNLSSFVDINGDGLMDYLHHDHERTQNLNRIYYYAYYMRVYLNNGNGFDRTYYCDWNHSNRKYDENKIYKGESSISPKGRYRGDCANPSDLL